LPAASTRVETYSVAGTTDWLKVNFGGTAAGTSRAMPKGFSAGAWRMATTAASVTRATGAAAGVATAGGGGGIAAVAGGAVLVGVACGGGERTGVVSGGGAGGAGASGEGAGTGVGETSWARPVPAANARTPASARVEKMRRLIEMGAKYSEM